MLTEQALGVRFHLCRHLERLCLCRVRHRRLCPTDRGLRASRTASAGFVLDALEQALHARRPVHGGLVHHSVHRVPPQAADPVTATALAQTDPTAAFECPSQPPRPGCCDDRLNPPSTSLDQIQRAARRVRHRAFGRQCGRFLRQSMDASRRKGICWGRRLGCTNLSGLLLERSRSGP